MDLYGLKVQVGTCLGQSICKDITVEMIPGHFGSLIYPRLHRTINKTLFFFFNEGESQIYNNLFNIMYNATVAGACIQCYMEQFIQFIQY